MFPPPGFGGLSIRIGKKPVIAAVNGLAFGDGCEMVINYNFVLASKEAKFTFPEVKRGVVAIAGVLPRLPRALGRQREMEMVLTGREVGTREAREWGMVNKIAEGDNGEEKGVVELAVQWAKEIAGNIQDAVLVSKEGVQSAWDGDGVEGATERLEEVMYKELVKGEIM
ncbi:MAG: hypothetical protein Q9217_006762 [Psora testacea]